MECPLCQFSNPAGALRCSKCDTPLPIGSELTEAAEPEAWAAPSRREGSKSASTSPPALVPGSVLGGRYEILQLLGEGGMGSVYKARDRELDRQVALKIIRPDLANRPEVLQRFKQELILARKVTHKNVIRIYDLGEADRIKFISMDYIAGHDLKTLLKEKGKFTPQESVSILAQVCGALDAAHSEGVIHRDLKPQNIMLDKQGKVTVMDFGIARSMEMPGLTTTGALVGTPEYMSPEQAKGEDVDARSDLFTLGIIFYELLTGSTPYKADSALALMLKRTQERARPPAERVPTIPRYLNDVVMKCLEINPKLRYQKAAEVLHDLEARQGPRTRTMALRLPRFRIVEELPTKWLAPGLAVIVLLIAGIVFRGRIFEPGIKPAPPAISLAIVPFRNASGDPSLDWLGPSLAEMLSTDVGQSSSLRTVSPDRLHQVLHDLRIGPNSSLDPDTLRRLAEFSNAQTMVWGQYAKFGDQIRIDATLQDLKLQRSIPLRAEAANDKELLPAIARLAQSIQQNLALPSDIVKELQATTVRPSSKSIQALRFYNEGLELAREGKHLEALKRFEASTKEDPEFALAYSRLGQTYANLGYDSEAERVSRKAVDLSEKLPPQEKYVILANHARVVNDNQKAIESYENLARASPDDPDVQFALGGAYEASGSLDRARERYGRVLERDPKAVDALLASGRVEIKSGNPQGGLEYLNRALTLAIQLENEEEKATILQAIGVAYRQLNRQEEALRNYQQSLEIKRRLGQKRGIAASLNEMAQIEERLGKPEQALKSYGEALQLRREIGDKKGEGDTLVDLGGFYHDRARYDQALNLFKESLQIQRELGNERNQALCLSNIGSCYFFKGEYEDALTYFQQALQLREKSKIPEEIVMTVHNLAETTARMGQYDKALTYYFRALELYRSENDTRGAAIESYSIGTLFQDQGRYGAALNSKQEALKTFRELKDRSFWMTEILSGYADALAEAGRGEEAQKSLEEALGLARELKNDAFVAQIMDFQGDSFFYRGDFKSARNFYEKALRVASHTTDRDRILLCKFNLAKVAAQQGRSGEATSALRNLAGEADRLGLKYLSAESSIYLAEALVNSKDYLHARQELDRALGESEKLGLRALEAKGQYLLATVLRATGNGAEASGHYREALRLLEEIGKEAGSDKVLQRSDLKVIYADSTRWSQGKKS